MKVFVAGATGAIGRLLVPRLVAAGHEVHAMTRSEPKQAMPCELALWRWSRTALDSNRSRRPWAAIRHLEEGVLGARWTEGIVLRYGAFYGPGTDAIAYPASPL